VTHPLHHICAENGFLGTAPCGMCGKLFTFDPARVPTFPIDTSQTAGIGRLAIPKSWLPNADEHREPVCRPCFREINAYRKQHGQPAHDEDPAFWGERD
jgi:hypothetical protein